MLYLFEALQQSVLLQLILTLFFTCSYLLFSIGLYTISDNRCLKNKWFSFIPFFQEYLIGEIINDHLFGVRGAKWFLSISPALIIILSFFNDPDGVLVTILIGIYYITIIWSFYAIYRLYSPKIAFFLFITGLVFFPINGLWIFLIRKRTPIVEEFY